MKINSQRLGRILILLGVAAWLPYFYLKYIENVEVGMLPFLAVHLSGVIPGSLLFRHKQIKKLLSPKRQK